MTPRAVYTYLCAGGYPINAQHGRRPVGGQGAVTVWRDYGRAYSNGGHGGFSHHPAVWLFPSGTPAAP